MKLSFTFGVALDCFWLLEESMALSFGRICQKKSKLKMIFFDESNECE